MLAEIRERIGKIFTPREPATAEIPSGIEGLVWKINPPFEFGYGDHYAWAHQDLVREVERHGIQLLNLSDVLSHKDLGDKVDNLVLFDTYDVVVLPGNHWRILEIDKERGVAKLQFCGTFGFDDLESIEPFELPMDTPFFTGVTVNTFTDKASGEIVPFLEARKRLVDEVNQGRLSTVKYSETIYFMEGFGPDLGLFTEYIKPQSR